MDEKPFSDVIRTNTSSNTIRSLLNERDKTHGSFAKNAEISQKLKAIFREQSMNQAQREALDMIALKLSRILSGKANFKDHWADIAGYAKLGEEACD